MPNGNTSTVTVKSFTGDQPVVVRLGETVATDNGLVIGWSTAFGDFNTILFSTQVFLTPVDSQAGVGADIAIPFDTWQGQAHSPQEAFMIDTGEGPDLTTTALSTNLFFDPPFASLLTGENNTAFAGNNNKLAGVNLAGGVNWSFNGPGSTPRFFGAAFLSESLDQGRLL